MRSFYTDLGDMTPLYIHFPGRSWTPQEIVKRYALWTYDSETGDLERRADGNDLDNMVRAFGSHLVLTVSLSAHRTRPAGFVPVALQATGRKNNV